MKKAWDNEAIRNAVNTGYSALQGNADLADRIIAKHQKKAPLYLPFVNRKWAIPVLIVSLFMITGAALALALMNRPVSVSTYGLWRYANGQLTYQGESDKHPRVILEDENIRFIAADNMDSGLYYITRDEGKNWLRNVTEGGYAITPGRIVNSKYNVIDLQVSSNAYILANTVHAQGQVFQLDVYGDDVVKDAAVTAAGWDNKNISAYSVYDDILYAYSAERNELATIDLSNRQLKYRPIPAGGILSLTAGMEKEGDPWVIALTQSEGSTQKRLLLVNTRTGEKQDTGENVPAWAEYVNRNRNDLYLLGAENQQVKNIRISALEGRRVLHELYIVNGHSTSDEPMAEAIRLFHQKYPDVELIFRSINDERVITTELMAGEGGIDVFGNISSGYTPEGMMLKTGVIRDLTDNPDIQKNWDDWRDMRRLVSVDGRQFGVLWELDLYAFAVSEEWAERIGWQIPDGPWSMEAFEALAQRVAEWNREHAEHLYLLCDERDPYFLIQYQTQRVDAYAGTADFETEEYLHLLNLYREMNDQELLYPREKLVGRVQGYDYMLPPNTLLRVSHGGLGWLNSAERVILPPSPDVQEFPYTAQGWYLFANANSKYPEEAEYFLACYSSAEAASKEYYRNFGQWLRDKNLYEAEEPIFAEWSGKLKPDTERLFNYAIVHALPYRNVRELYWTEQDLLPVFLQGGMTAEEFAATMQRQADMILGE